MFSVGRPATGGIRPGDVLVLEGGGHTAIALGGGLMIHASKPGQPVAIVKIYANPNAVRRLVG
jgi:cell wall-associated NlpC family hydrolase